MNKNKIYHTIVRLLQNARLCPWCTVKQNTAETSQIEAEKAWLQGHARTGASYSKNIWYSCNHFTKAF